MKKVQFTFDFGRKKKNNKGLIELRAYLSGKQKYFTTKMYVLPVEWNKNKQQIVRHKNKDNLNDQLDTIIERLEKSQRKASDNNQIFNLETVKILMNKEKLKTNSFTDFSLKEIEEDNSLVKGTKHSKKNTLNKLLIFNESTPVLFEQINYSFCHDFINYVKGLGFSPSTVLKHHKNFKSLIELAIKKGYYQKNNPLKEIHIKVPIKRVIALSKEQVKNIEKLKFEPYENRLELFRDMFLFSCYTGLRVSDITTLKPEHIKEKEDGIYIEKQTIKTKKIAILPLSRLFPLKEENTSKPIKILNKHLQKNNDLVFKKYCDQVYNRELKQIAFRAKIKDINLTAHIGRKTFATFIGNHTSLSVWELQYLLQHSNIKTTEKYVFTDEKRINESLIKTDWE